MRCSSAPFAGRAPRSRPGRAWKTSRPAGTPSGSLRREAGEVDYLFIAGGGAPDVESLRLGGAGIEVERDGQIEVDDYGQTTQSQGFVMGDLVRGKALAHKASAEAVVAVERAVGVDTHPIDQNLLVSATFHPPAGGERRHRGTLQGRRQRGQGWHAELSPVGAGVV